MAHTEHLLVGGQDERVMAQGFRPGRGFPLCVSHRHVESSLSRRCQDIINIFKIIQYVGTEKTGEDTNTVTSEEIRLQVTRG